jgi:hypothetical protein
MAVRALGSEPASRSPRARGRLERAAGLSRIADADRHVGPSIEAEVV